MSAVSALLHLAFHILVQLFPKDMAGATVYVTLFPCHECAKTLVQAGIGEVVYLDDKYHDTEDGVVSRSILDRCGISYRQVVVAE